jgi:hypothetical protein
MELEGHPGMRGRSVDLTATREDLLLCERADDSSSREVYDAIPKIGSMKNGGAIL